MGDNSSQEVIPQQEVELVKRSEMCIGLNVMMTLPKNTVTGITIVMTQSVTNPTLTQLVTNTRQHKVKPMQNLMLIHLIVVNNIL